MINSNKILDEGVKYISEGLIKNNTLMELNIENNKITNIGLKLLSKALNKNKNFLKLIFVIIYVLKLMKKLINYLIDVLKLNFMGIKCQKIQLLI